MKRLSAMLSSLVAVMAGMVAASPPASASTSAVDVVFSCSEAGSEQVALTYAVEISAPKTVRRGATIPLTVTAAKPAPADIPANGIVGEMEIVLGGAVSGQVTATGLANTTDVPVGEPMTLGPGTASVSATTTGPYTFAPGSFVMDLWVGATLECTLPDGGPVLAKTYVV